MSPPVVLLAYHSYEGQTSKIADRIASQLAASGFEADVLDANEAPPPLGYDAVILGDSIHLGEHSQSLTRFARRHAAELHKQPLALFQVSLTSATDDDEHSAKAHELLHGFTDETGIDPDIVALFAGSLAYTKYGWFKRRMMRRLVLSEIADAADISHDHEFTDWEAVEAFAADVVTLAGGA